MRTTSTSRTMAKRSLAEAAKGVAPVQRGYEPWYVRLRRQNPKQMEEIEGWVEEWNSGAGRDKFTANSFALFIAAHTEGLVRNAPPIIKYIQGRADGKPRRSK